MCQNSKTALSWELVCRILQKREICYFLEADIVDNIFEWDIPKKICDFMNLNPIGLCMIGEERWIPPPCGNNVPLKLGQPDSAQG